MTLEELIHAWLADTGAEGVEALQALLPVARVVTGQLQTAPATSESSAPSEDFPYAELSIEGEADAWRTNCGEATRSTCRIRVWDPEHAKIASIREALVSVFHWKRYAPVGAGRRIELARRENAFALQEEDGVWTLIFDLLVIHAPT